MSVFCSECGDFVYMAPEDSGSVLCPACQCDEDEDADDDECDVLIEPITGDNRRPGMEHQEGYLVRFDLHPDFGWMKMKTFPDLESATAFARELK